MKGTSKKHPSASLPANSQSSRTSMYVPVARLLAPSIWALFRGSLNKLIKIFATVFGAGYSPVAPGTVGSVFGVALFWALSGLPILHYVLFVIVFIFFASWVSDQAQVVFNEKDPQRVVIDEVAGILVTMTFYSWNWKIALAGFVLFRFFDIWKPFPIKKIETNLSNGFGVVLDDVLAGVYANVCLFVIASVSEAIQLMH